MPTDKLREYLDSNNVKYTIIEHDPAFTAQEVAAAAHIPGKQLAKAVMIKIDGEMAMAILPASYRVNFDRLQEQTGAKELELATEKEFKGLFPDCDVGAMPPFGNLYSMKVFAAESLAEQIDIAFCAGSHTELIRISFEDFQRLVEPKILEFTYAG
ncbi:MAG: YbaK/EbsC family protein [Anaerolineales bacterium]|nr:MAG: YbaK/EbsC family protein [Anaerolineales bacterium]